MNATIIRLVAAAVSVVWCAVPAAQQFLEPRLDSLLSAAAAYLAQYERDVAGIVAEEDYRQEAVSQRPRRLRSDLLVVNDEQEAWIEFRDVYDVDGKPVRDREQRLVALFLKPGADRRGQALRISQEGARFNLHPRGSKLPRTLNTPLVALHFLQARYQDRSTFTVNPARSVKDGGNSVVVEFDETSKPRLINTPDEKAARGAFWIDPYSGRVTATELIAQSGAATAFIYVTYAEDPKLKIWLPRTMTERYQVGRRETIRGYAEYSNFRQFRVETTTDIAK